MIEERIKALMSIANCDRDDYYANDDYDDDKANRNCGVVEDIEAPTRETVTSINFSNGSDHGDLEYKLNTDCRQNNICTVRNVLNNVQSTNVRIVGISDDPTQQMGRLLAIR